LRVLARTALDRLAVDAWTATVLLHPLCARRSSQLIGISVSAVPWKMITGLWPSVQVSKGCVPPEWGATPAKSGRVQPNSCEKYPPMEKPVANTCRWSTHWSASMNWSIASMNELSSPVGALVPLHNAIPELRDA
jgi:hypothetical protein